MGREAVCMIRKGQERGEGRVHLDGAGIEIRGAVRGRIARSALVRHAVAAGTLQLWTAAETYELDLGEKEALAWARALSKPPPTLAEKLGIGPGKPVRIVGSIRDEVALDAIRGAQAHPAGAASQLVAELHSAADLGFALDEATRAGLPVWCLYPRGRGAVPSDAAVRAAFRGAGWIDVKSCAVSDEITATRYQRRNG